MSKKRSNILPALAVVGLLYVASRQKVNGIGLTASEYQNYQLFAKVVDNNPGTDYVTRWSDYDEARGMKLIDKVPAPSFVGTIDTYVLDPKDKTNVYWQLKETYAPGRPMFVKNTKYLKAVTPAGTIVQINTPSFLEALTNSAGNLFGSVAPYLLLAGAGYLLLTRKSGGSNE